MLRRVLRRGYYEARKIQTRVLGDFQRFSDLPDSEFCEGLDSGFSCLPGNPSLLPSEGTREFAIKEDISWWRAPNLLINHKLQILSKEFFELSDENLRMSPVLRDISREIPKAYKAKYRSIAWHKDFKTGFEWPTNVWYFDKRLTSRNGADIKVPWELSRFVHLGQLVHVDFEVGGHEYILQVLDWISANPRFRGVNWASELVVALRAINWIWGLSLFRSIVVRYPLVLRTITLSLRDHFKYLQRNLAYHELYSDDHYLADLVGILYITTAFPGFHKSDEWLLFSIAGIKSEMSRQVLADGYSHMMSTHYHRFVAELFASGASLAERIPEARRSRMHRMKPASAWPYVSYDYCDENAFDSSESVFPNRFYDQLRKMVYLSVQLTKPDGKVPQFGDNDSARAHKFFASSPEDLSDHRHLASVVGTLLQDDQLCAFGKVFEFEGSLIAGGLDKLSLPKPSLPFEGLKSVIFPNCNIAVLRNSNAYLAVTCSENGYHGKGGHGHNDKGSFVLSVLGQDIFVDGGCPYYTSVPELRNAFRSTSAHNTLVVIGQEQDPIPEDLFSLPATSNADLHLEMIGNSVDVDHNKYGEVHHRRFELFDDRMEILDTFLSEKKRYLAFNLSPTIQATVSHSNSLVKRVKLKAQNGITVFVMFTGVAEIDIREGQYGVGYGQPVANSKLICHLNNTITKVEIFWNKE